jgi:monoterpene epsilon-lactone hydrolase
MAHESDIVRDHWTWAAAQQRSRSEIDTHWSALSGDPAGVASAEAEGAPAPALWVEPDGADPATVLFFIHGGGFVSGSPRTHAKLAGHLASAVGSRALVVGYGLAPEHVYPEPLDEVTATYEWLLGQGVAAERIAVVGDSCGAWLALSLALRARARGLGMPAALLLVSPWVDLSQGGASYLSNAENDPFFAKAQVDAVAGMFLGGADPKDAELDLLQADYAGLPPMHIQVGGDETLLDDSRVLESLATAAGVEATLEVVPGQLHTFQMAAGRLPRADEAVAALAAWVGPRLTSTRG